MSMSKAADPKYGIKKSALLPLNNEINTLVSKNK